MNLIAAVLFALALLHTFAAKTFEHLAHRWPRHAGLLHLLGEVEVVFGFWAIVLVTTMALVQGTGQAVQYAESRQYTEPLFVFVVMVVAASAPIRATVQRAVAALARRAGAHAAAAQVWLCMAVLPLVGSLITEPAAMTVAALALSPLVFERRLPEALKYLALGTLFVNVSIGGTLTSFAAPPVLMVAGAWGWTSAFMAHTFGWKCALAVLVNATWLTLMLRRHLGSGTAALPPDAAAPSVGPLPAPWPVTLMHFLFLALVVVFAHHPVIFIGLFLMFLGFTHAYERFQSPLILKEALLVGFFLAGLVVLGGMQQWWLQPLVSSLSPKALFFGALGLTAVTDNAALTYLGSLIEGLSDTAKYMLMAGAVAGGGLTVIANAPNPAGAALLRHGFEDQSIGAPGLLLGALLPTAVAVAALWWL